MSRLALRPIGRLLGSLAPDFAAEMARRLATRPSTPSRRPEPAGATPVSFRFGLAGLRWGHRGPMVLAIHGWEGRASQFRGIGEAVAAHGFQLVAMDAPAHGRSPGREADPVVFADALQEVAAEVGPLHAVIGHSMGGASALLALSRGLQARAAVAIAAPARMADVLGRISGALGLPEDARRRFFAKMQSRTGLAPEALDIERLAPVLRGPMLVVHDEDDPTIPFDDARRIAAATEASLLATRGLGHRAVLRDAGVANEVAAFLARAA